MKFENTDVFGFEGAIRGMRNPLNSWGRMDSKSNELTGEFEIGSNDLQLMQALIRGGGEHRKFMRMIHVQVDVTMPRYFWSELDTYHFGTKNSCSTMHKLLNTNEPISKELFVYCEEDEDFLNTIICRLEGLRSEYRRAGAPQVNKDRLLLRAKRLLPEGFLQKRTWDTNYEEIRNIYHQRKHHRLKEEWQDTFCSWVESLPYFTELIGFN